MDRATDREVMLNKYVFTIARVMLWAVMIAWCSYGLWTGWHRTGELLALRSSGKRVNAQVIGCEQMHANERVGFVHYAFNEGSRSIDSRLAVPISAYSTFHIGQAIPVTYLPQDPHIVRIGVVDSGTVARSAMVAFVFLIAGLIAFGLPLVAISSVVSTRRQSAALM